MADSFAGAEADVDSQKKSALDALAAFGRRGLEAAVVSQLEGNRVQTDAAKANTAFGDKLGVGAAGQAELSALGAAGREAYASNGAQTASFMASENRAAGSVNANYFGQLRQAVPLARTEAQQMADQYRAAWEERQAQAAADAEAQRLALQTAALEQQALRDQMAREQELHDLEYGPYLRALALQKAKEDALARAAAYAKTHTAPTLRTSGAR